MTTLTQLLRGAPNFRDFGGHPTQDGRRVRQGVLFRSGALNELSDEDLAQLRNLRPRLVMDLRSAHEQTLHPSRWPEDARPRARSFQVTADVRADQRSPLIAMQGLQDAEGGRAIMDATYRSLSRMSADALGALFEELAESHDALPVVVHCTAGKDRTGFVCSALLHALGVDEALIEADYLRSGDYIDRVALNRQVAPIMRQAMQAEPSQALLDAINTVEREYLRSAWAAATATYGNPQAYLAQACGLSDARRARLQERLLGD